MWDYFLIPFLVGTIAFTSGFWVSKITALSQIDKRQQELNHREHKLDLQRAEQERSLIKHRKAMADELLEMQKQQQDFIQQQQKWQEDKLQHEKQRQFSVNHLIQYEQYLKGRLPAAYAERDQARQHIKRLQKKLQALKKTGAGETNV